MMTDETTNLHQDPFLDEKGHPLPLHEVERRAICRALTWAKGHREATAAALKISKNKLIMRLKKYGISRNQPTKRKLTPRRGANV